MKSPKPYSVGRIVNYVPQSETTPRSLPETYNGADICPAIIVRTWEGTGYQNDEVNLRVICDGPGDAWRTSVPYDENGAPGTWHWPTIAAVKADDSGGSNPPGGGQPGKP